MSLNIRTHIYTRALTQYFLLDICTVREYKCYIIKYIFIVNIER